MMQEMIRGVLRDDSSSILLRTNDDIITSQTSEFNDLEIDLAMSRATCINVKMPFLCRSKSSKMMVLNDRRDDDMITSNTNSTSVSPPPPTPPPATTTTMGMRTTLTSSHSSRNVHGIPVPSITSSMTQVRPIETICCSYPNHPSKDLSKTSMLKQQKTSSSSSTTVSTTSSTPLTRSSSSSTTTTKTTCLICYEPLKRKRRIMHHFRFQCSHGSEIHKKCMNQWIQMQLGKGIQPVCPMCRKRVKLTWLIPFPKS